MTFIQEPTHHIKTVLSDLQGAWGVLRSSVVENFDFKNSDKLLFHIDEAMSWESVRNLQIMKSTFIIVRNIALQSNTNEEILEAIEDVQDDLDEALQSLADGDIS
jgi:hypothetical protein